MKIMLNVVAIKEKKFFYERESGLYFDSLTALPHFEGGTFIILRNEEELAKGWIHEYGTHAACTCFYGDSLMKILKTFVTSSLSAKDFQESDRLIIEIQQETLDLEAELKSLFIFLKGVKHIPIGKTMKMDELCERLALGIEDEVAQIGEENLKDLKVLEFRKA